MTKEEFKNKFWTEYNSCYPIYKDDNIYMIYDKSFVRQRKLSRVLGYEIEIPTKIEGDLLFIIDTKLNFLKYDILFLTYIRNFLSNILYTNDLIKELISENSTLKSLTPFAVTTLSMEGIKTRLSKSMIKSMFKNI